MNKRLLIAGVLVLAFILRILWVDNSLPEFPEIDETFIVAAVSDMGGPATVTPDFIYPTMIYRLNLFSVRLLDHFGRGSRYNYYLVGRIYSVLFSVLQVLMVFLIGKKIYSQRAGIIAALLLALIPIHISQSCSVRTDMPMTLMILVAFYYVCVIYLSPTIRVVDCFKFGVFMGLAMSFKYNALAVFLPFVGVLALKREDIKKIAGISVFVAFITAFFVFFILNPHIILNFGEFLGEMYRQVVLLLGEGPFGVKNRAWLRYILIMFEGFGEGLMVIVAGALIWGVFNRRAKDMLMLIFPVFYYLFMGWFREAPVRYILPVIPFLVIFTGDFLERLRVFILKTGQKKLYLLVLVILLVPTVYRSGYYVAWAMQDDTRAEAKRWIKENVPIGASILIDGAGRYKPILFDVYDFDYTLVVVDVTREPEIFLKRIRENDFDYFVFDKYNKSRHPNVAPVYEYVDNNFQLMSEFKTPLGRPRVFNRIFYSLINPHIRIYSAESS